MTNLAQPIEDVVPIRSTPVLKKKIVHRLNGNEHETRYDHVEEAWVALRAIEKETNDSEWCIVPENYVFMTVSGRECWTTPVS